MPGRLLFFCSLLLALGLSWSASAHALLQTRLSFRQEGRALTLEALLDPLSLSSALKERGLDLRASAQSLEAAREEIGLLLDEHLVLRDQDRECLRDAPSTRVRLGAGSAVLVKARYLCDAAPQKLSIRCDLFSTEREAHLIAATLVAHGETLTFVFDATNPVFIAPIARSAPSTPESIERVAAADPRGPLAGASTALFQGMLHSLSAGHLLLLLGLFLALSRLDPLPRAVFLLPAFHLSALFGLGLPGPLVEVLFTGGVFFLLTLPLARTPPSPPLPIAYCLLPALLALHGLAAAHLVSGMGLSFGRRSLLAASYELGGALPELLGIGVAWFLLPRVGSGLQKRAAVFSVGLLVAGALWLGTRLLGGGLF